jgi:hypothetical protein
VLDVLVRVTDQVDWCSMDLCSPVSSARAMSTLRGFARSASGMVIDRTPLPYDA